MTLDYLFQFLYYVKKKKNHSNILSIRFCYEAGTLPGSNNEHPAPWMEMSSELATMEKRRVRTRGRSVRKCLIHGNKNH